MTDCLARELTCIDCGTVHPLGYRLECEKCQGLLELSYGLDVLRARGPAALTGGGLWRYAPVLPIADPAHRVTLGEGGTPLLDCPRLAKVLGVRSLAVKFEGANPTGTVKDRSSATGGGRAPVRLHGDLRRVERQRGLLDRRLLGPRGLALADLRVRARVGAEALAHGRHHRGSRPLRGRLRRPHHALGPARCVAAPLRPPRAPP